MRFTQHPLSAAAAIGALAAASLLPTGCSSSAGGCTSQTVTLNNVALSNIAAAFDLTATVKADGGKSLAGVPVEFWAWGRPSGQSSSVGVKLGTGTTDASGDATLHVPPIVQGNELSRLDGLTGLIFARVSANSSARTIAGVEYCAGKTNTPVTCGSDSQTCPPVTDRP